MEREQKREGERKRREYLLQKEKHAQEIQARRTASPKPKVTEATAPDDPPVEEAAGAPPEVIPAETSESPRAERPSAPARVPTFIVGLDDAIGGGFPSGFVIVIGGSPGTMKSSLAFRVVAENAQHGRRALYLACEQSTGGLLSQMEGLGINLAGVPERVKVVDSVQLRRILESHKGDWLPGLKALVDGARTEGGIDLFVIDSLDGLDAIAAFEPRRRELFRLFEWLRDLGVTTIVVAERPDYLVQGTVLQPRHDEDFLADGVITLRLHPISDQDVQRRLRIVKMRGTRHETAYLALHVSDGEFQVGRLLGT
ncbi:MAG TPA: ATPase domain-containing protein [Thermoplasmata archaeon]|nr:ATPase domain-containing protein [Thermoplasmata archaeon]